MKKHVFRKSGNSSIFKLFLKIAKELNSLDVVPIIYGSLGLYISIGEKGVIKDIDILLKDKDKKNHWDDIKSIMKSLGYRLDPKHCEEFIGKKPYVAFSDMKGMKDVSGNIRKLIKARVDGIDFLNLPLKKYLSIYENGLKNEWRKKKKEKDDLLKMYYIREEIRK